MTKTKLYIATTLDGFIAREDGSLDWLDELSNPNQTDYGYGEFYATIDTVVMGRKTYEDVLGFGVDWPYADSKTYVVTSKPDYQTKTENTSVIHQISTETIASLKAESEKNIWVVGGGKVITAMLNQGQIDEMMLCLIPTILGKGIQLFPDNPVETKFDLINTESFETGAVILTYSKKMK